METNQNVENSFDIYSRYLTRKQIQTEQLKDCILPDLFTHLYEFIRKSKSLPVPKNFLPKEVTKSSDNCRVMRIRGNDFYSRRLYIDALKSFTLAVGKAPADSNELALAYGDRSAVTFQLKEYEDCLIDIERALSGNYSHKLVYKIYERKGDCLMAIDKAQEAIDAYENALLVLKMSDVEESNASEIRVRFSEKLSTAKAKASEEKPDDTPENVPKSKKNLSDSIFQLAHPASKAIECASESVKIGYSEDMGRFIEVTEDIKPGEVIAIEKPYGFLLLMEESILFCDFCFKRCHSSVPCDNCEYVFFCNETCRAKSWERSHIVECSFFQTLINLNFDKTSLLAVHLVLLMTDQGRLMIDDFEYFIALESRKKAVGDVGPEVQSLSLGEHSEPRLQHTETNLKKRTMEKVGKTELTARKTYPPELRGFFMGKYSANRPEPAYYLETNQMKHSMKSIRKIALIAAYLLNTLIPTKFYNFITEKEGFEMYGDLDRRIGILDGAVGSMLMNFLLNIPSNARYMTELRVKKVESKIKKELVNVGYGIFSFLGLLNHSCDPNVTRITLSSGAVALVAIKSIKKGEQLFDNYGVHFSTHDFTKRFEILNTEHYFACKCKPCSEKWPLAENFPSAEKCLPDADDKEIAPSVEKLNTIAEDVTSGDQNTFEFLCKFLVEIENTYEMPSALYIKCQNTLKEFLEYHGMCYKMN